MDLKNSTADTNLSIIRKLLKKNLQIQHNSRVTGQISENSTNVSNLCSCYQLES